MKLQQWHRIWGGCFARRFFPPVYHATAVTHSFARRRGVTRTPGCAVAMYRNRHQSPCISDSFAFQDQHITKSTEMVFAPNPTAASTDSKKKSVVFYSCGRTSPSDLDGILLGSPTPRCEG